MYSKDSEEWEDFAIDVRGVAKTTRKISCSFQAFSLRKVNHVDLGTRYSKDVDVLVW
uniref:Uncharacterized protein n=1 Tax=Hyaloperonospora arabidopsidis (strain Emoy2) TaxID=559515 RepID=M4BVY1_HYAAE